MIKQANKPEDIFGAIPDDVKKNFKRLYKTVFADHYRENQEAFVMASVACGLVNEFYERAKARIANGLYGKNSLSGINVKISTASSTYELIKKIHEGGTYDIYLGSSSSGEKVIAKITSKSEYRMMVVRESKILKRLEQSEGERPSIPKFKKAFKTKNDRNGMIMNYIDGYDLFLINELFPGGIPNEHLVWMMKRMFEICVYCHSKGVIHGSINPGHLMVVPKQHTIVIIDWSHSLLKPSETGDKYKQYSPEYSAPEVRDNDFFHPSSDLYSVGKVMNFLAYGNKSVSSADKRIMAFIKWLCSENRKERPQNAAEGMKYLDQVVDNVFGKTRRFVPFIVPVS